jgi:hypothetical protein
MRESSRLPFAGRGRWVAVLVVLLVAGAVGFLIARREDDTSRADGVSVAPSQPGRAAGASPAAGHASRTAAVTGATGAGDPSAAGAKPAPAGASPPATSLTLAWVGDIALNSRLGPGAFAGVAHRLRAADLAVGNLEGALSRRGDVKCAGGGGSACFAFVSPPANAGRLRAAGFDVANLANNHALDAGAAGRGDTVAALHAAGIASTGARGQVTIVRRGGVRIALLGFAPYRWASPLLDLGATRRLVRRAARRADLVVVLMHAGAEGTGALHTPRGPEHAYGEARGNARAFAHAAVAAGADLVLGSGPHVIRGVERHRGRLIAYSLGNFAGDPPLVVGGVLGESAIITVRVRADGVALGGRWAAVRIEGGRPRPDPTGASIALVRRLSRADFGARAYPIAADGRLGPSRTGARGTLSSARAAGHSGAVPEHRRRRRRTTSSMPGRAACPARGRRAARADVAGLRDCLERARTHAGGPNDGGQGRPGRSAGRSRLRASVAVAFGRTRGPRCLRVL